VGHSKGAAKAILNALHLLTDEHLGIGGVTTIEESTTVSDGDMEFYVTSKKTRPINKGNVQTIVFESPRVFSSVAALQAQEIIGVNNILRIESRKKGSALIDRDLVVDMAPQAIGFEHIGRVVAVDGNGFSLLRHGFTKVRDEALPVVEAHIESLRSRTGTPSEQDSDIPACVSTEIFLPIGTIFGISFGIIVCLCGMILVSLLLSVLVAAAMDVLCICINKLL